LSGRGLCDELITRPEESYRLCCVVVCDLETSRMGAPYIYDISRLRVNMRVDCDYWQIEIEVETEQRYTLHKIMNLKFLRINSSGPSMALGSIQPLREMRNTGI